jgi:ankyrin repeat protein
LLQKGADANAIPNKNIDDTVLEETLAPMYMICKALDAEYRHLLANFDIEVSETESMADHQSKMFYQRTLESISKDLLGHGAQLSPCIMQMMHDAARRGNTGTIWFWIAHLKADPNTRGRQGMTPLHFAARSGKADVAELLLSFDGIDLTVVDDRGKSSMDAAVANGRQEVVDLLKEHCHYIS